MGVISCRDREASLILNYVRVKVTAKCYCSDLETETGDEIIASPGERESLLGV